HLPTRPVRAARDPPIKGPSPRLLTLYGRFANRPYGLWTYAQKVIALTEVEVQKLLHDQWDIFTRSIQPVLWLLLFGGVFGRLRILPPGLGSYPDFVAPGILAQSVLTISIFHGIMVLWERDLVPRQTYPVIP